MPTAAAGWAFGSSRRARSTGVEFIEFAVDGPTRLRLGETLRALGFRQTGRHRTKRVALWSQNGVNLVLNASRSQHTASARFLTESFGSGVQHIAFRTDDIFATAGSVRAAGLAVLPVPDNDDDDLDARFVLEDGLLGRMRAGGVLYDRDAEGGEFFQVFTRTFDDRFFFEIVERRRYKGFGAPNAAIRLAVQNRLSRHPAVPRRGGRQEG